LESTKPLEAETASLRRVPADPTRRRIRRLLRTGPAITGETAATSPISRIAGDASLRDVGRGSTDRQSQAAWRRRHCLNAVPLERLRWAGPVEAGFASGVLRILRRAERWCASRPGDLKGLVETGSAEGG